MQIIKTSFLIFVSIFIFKANVFAFEEEDKIENDNFEYTSSGKITAYYGDSIVFIPPEVGQTEIKEIGEKAFFNSEISNVYIGSGIEKIGYGAFEGSEIEYVGIPKSVEVVGERAFADCNLLANVVLENEQVIFEKNAFEKTEKICFSVPCVADFDEIGKKIFAVKGDDNFELIQVHSEFIQDEDEEGIVYKCSGCGYQDDSEGYHFKLPFDDVPIGEWYYSAVCDAYDEGILSGKTKNEFKPDDGLTCAEAVKIAACIYSSKNNVIKDFSDSNGANWFDVYVDFCYSEGIIEDDVAFDWNENITRAKMAYIFSRCDNDDCFLNEVELEDIPDVYYTTPFAKEILDLYNKGVAVGSDVNYTFYPDEEIKRSEAAVIISRILNVENRVVLPKD